MLLALAVLSASSCLLAQTTKNPFSELGYKKHITYTSSKGEFEEFHNNVDVVEIGSVYFNTQTNKVVGYVNPEKEKAEVATATSAMSVDPLCEKYYWISPYAYCLNNPVKFVDPDGRLVVFAPGASAQFKESYTQTTNYLAAKGAGGALSTLQVSPMIYYVAEGKGDGSYSAGTRTITWDPKLGLMTNEGHDLSPATVLNHEFGHAVDHNNNPEQYAKDSDPKNSLDKRFDDNEEKNVIQGVEQDTAKKLGEIKDGEVTRKDHDGFFFTTKSPISNESANSVTVTAKKVEKPEKK